MSKIIYNLQILCSNDEQIEKVSNLLNIKPTKQMSNIWCLEVEEKESDEYFDFINHFLDILEGKYKQLESIEISREDISLWFLYEYKDQCNMEFLPNDLKRLGDNGIGLCVSCWGSG